MPTRIPVAERLASTTAPSADLDAEVLASLFFSTYRRLRHGEAIGVLSWTLSGTAVNTLPGRQNAQQPTIRLWRSDDERPIAVLPMPDLTGDLDAAVAVVEREFPSSEWCLYRTRSGYRASINMSWQEQVSGEARMAAAALLVALLEARHD